MMASRRFLLLLLGLVAALGQVHAAEPVVKTANNAAQRTIEWDALLPPGWDPLKDFRDNKLAVMSDSDPRALELLQRMREAWDKAPVNPDMNNQQVRIPGYVVPLEETKGLMREFLLVPYMGACIHTPPPPANQIIHVQASQPKKLHMMDAVWVSGRLSILHSDTPMGASGYALDLSDVEPYVDSADKSHQRKNR
jgi:hypothetical protein